MLTDTRERLDQIEGRLRDLREESTRATRVAVAAKAAAQASDTDESLNAAEQATTAVRAVEAAIEHAQEEQVALLRRIGDAEAGRGGAAFAGMNGWSDVTRQLNIERGDFRAEVPLGALMQQSMVAGIDVEGDPSSVATKRVPFVAQPLDRRHLYPVFPRQSLDLGALAVVEFRESVSSGAVSGDVIRDPLSVEPKAELDLGITAGSEDVEQFAITVDNVPQVLFASEPALEAFLQSRMQHVLDLAVDTHTMAQIEAASVPSGSSGTNLIEQVRNAVSSARALGANPSVLALSPEAAAGLDLTTTGADGAYVFATRGTGSASPLWSLRIVESPSVSDPILMDPALLGVLYAGTGTITIDPYTGLKTNTVRLRLEIEALLHVRSPAGAFVIA